MSRKHRGQHRQIDRDEAPRGVDAYECQTERLRFAKSHLERLEIDLSELYSGATRGWPLRGEVS